MTSAASPKAKPPISCAPDRLTPSEIASLRADKQEIHRRLNEKRAAEKAAQAALAKVAAE